MSNDRVITYIFIIIIFLLVYMGIVMPIRKSLCANFGQTASPLVSGCVNVVKVRE